MFALLRTLVYGVVFVGFLLVYVPARLLARSGVVPPASVGLQQAAGLALAAGGAALLLWCLLNFVFVGRGTPAPFDPPRRLVAAGPYRFVRNPIYIGAGLVLASEALYYGSAALLGYLALFLVIAHMFVVFHEEPVLSRRFGADYVAYCARVQRWRPKFGTPAGGELLTSGDSHE